jgi:hypothetical protein
MSSSRKGSIAVVAGILIMVLSVVWFYDICYIIKFNPLWVALAVIVFMTGVVLTLWGAGKNP